MNVIDTKISEIKIIEPKIYGDERGFFYESFQAKRYEELLGITDRFVQDNFSRSQKRGTKRFALSKSTNSGKTGFSFSW